MGACDHVTFLRSFGSDNASQVWVSLYLCVMKKVAALLSGCSSLIACLQTVHTRRDMDSSIGIFLYRLLVLCRMYVLLDTLGQDIMRR
jgi:hypothetical protein